MDPLDEKRHALTIPMLVTGTIVGLCILNEPWTTAVGGPITLDEVKNWAQTAVDALVGAGWKGDIWYPDGFQLTWGGWRDFLKPPQYEVGGAVNKVQYPSCLCSRESANSKRSRMSAPWSPNRMSTSTHTSICSLTPTSEALMPGGKPIRSAMASTNRT